jgi:2-keto-4-pentenoate hydratase/2-oxohepta-3-ene-1,7-dioic acid hydratase in catechol pathway
LVAAAPPVDSTGRWFDTSRVSDGVISADPMAAWLQVEVLHRVSGTIDNTESDGNLSDADVRPPNRSPRRVFAVGLNYQSHPDKSEMKLPNAPLIFTKFPSGLPVPPTPSFLVEAPTTTKQSLLW